MTTMNKEAQEKMTPREALNKLIEGNKRFTSQKLENRDLLAQASQTSSGQFPFAVTLSCIDSRTSMEQVFDQGIGDIFSTRIAGNIINEDILGSMEFSCAAAGSKLIAVIGHTKCGAVKGACDNVKLGNLTVLLDKIQPAIAAEKTVTDSRDSSNDDFVEKVSLINVKKSVDGILEKSEVLRDLVSSGKVGIVGATHDIATGEIHFHEDTFKLG
jgi:carbonic anhydrase